MYLISQTRHKLILSDLLSLNYSTAMADENIKGACRLFQLGFLSLTKISCGVSCHVFKYCSLPGMHCSLVFHSCAFFLTKNTVIQMVKTNSIHLFVLPTSFQCAVSTSASVSGSLCFAQCCLNQRTGVGFIHQSAVCIASPVNLF